MFIVIKIKGKYVKNKETIRIYIDDIIYFQSIAKNIRYVNRYLNVSNKLEIYVGFVKKGSNIKVFVGDRLREEINI